MALSSEDRERLIRVEAKLDQLIESKSDHERRIRWLERYSWLLIGGGSIVSAVLGKYGFHSPFNS